MTDKDPNASTASAIGYQAMRNVETIAVCPDGTDSDAFQVQVMTNDGIAEVIVWVLHPKLAQRIARLLIREGIRQPPKA